MKQVFITWTVKATGQVKRTKAPIARDTAIKLVNFLNCPNAASYYETKNQESCHADAN